MIRVLDYMNQRANLSVSEAYAPEFMKSDHGEGIVAVWKIINGVKYIVLTPAYLLYF